MILIYNIYTYFILAWLITHFDPFKQVMTHIPYKKMKPLFRFIFSSIDKVISCMMCCSFWLTLLLSGNIILAASMSFIGFWYSKILGPLETYTKFE